MDSTQYHLRELAVARSANDLRRAVPEIPGGCQRVLDIGCGAGQTLAACDLKGAQAFGIDFELEALQLGKQWNLPVEWTCASGEALPFASHSFGFVFSRVALPYMNITAAVSEMARILQPGGGLWLSLHPLSMFSPKRALGSSRQLAYEVYKLTNTAAFHYLGWEFRYPLRKARVECYQTEKGMRRVLQQAGFEDIRPHRGRHFVITAQKRGGASGSPRGA